MPCSRGSGGQKAEAVSLWCPRSFLWRGYFPTLSMLGHGPGRWETPPGTWEGSQGVGPGAEGRSMGVATSPTEEEMQQCHSHLQLRGFNLSSRRQAGQTQGLPSTCMTALCPRARDPSCRRRMVRSSMGQPCQQLPHGRALRKHAAGIAHGRTGQSAMGDCQGLAWETGHGLWRWTDGGDAGRAV